MFNPITNIQSNQRVSNDIQLTSEIPISQGVVYIDSEYNQQYNPYDITNGLAVAVSGNDLFGKMVNSFSPKTVRLAIYLYNVNPRNNTVRFYSTNSASFHTVNIIPGRYTTATALMDALVAALNTVAGASGLTFSHAVNPSIGGVVNIDSRSFRLNSAGGNYHFDVNCTAIQKGKYLYNLPRSQNDEASKNVGRVLGYYTRWIDFSSNALTEDSRVGSYANSTYNTKSVLFTIYVSNLENIDSSTGILDLAANRWFLKEYSKSIATADIKLFDEFGEPLYEPQLDSATPINDWYDIQFTAQ